MAYFQTLLVASFLTTGAASAQVTTNDLARIASIQQARIAGLQENPWMVCGSMSKIERCELPNYPTTRYEYAFAYNTTEPIPYLCVYWNRGQRLVNKTPYLMGTDNPLSEQRIGGAMFYKGTDAPDDPIRQACPGGGSGWRHQYWYQSNNPGGALAIYGSNGCADLPLYCRIRR